MLLKLELGFIRDYVGSIREGMSIVENTLLYYIKVTLNNMN